jgi:hypothetical protein
MRLGGPPSGPGRSRAGVKALAILLVLGTAPVPAAGQDWSGLTRDFARAWERREPAALQRLMAPSLTLLVEGKEYLGVSPRQAVARVGPVLEGYPPRRPGLIRSGAVEGETDRAFAEFSWSPEAEGAGPNGFILFLGLRLLDGEWRLAELRILR